MMYQVCFENNHNAVQLLACLTNKSVHFMYISMCITLSDKTFPTGGSPGSPHKHFSASNDTIICTQV